MTNLDTLYLQSVVVKWRMANQWADSVPFESFPEKYKAEIELAAHINQNN